MRFVRTKRYEKDLKRIGASDTDALAIETAIAERPEAGDVIKGLHGMRKIRFGVGGRGKRGGGRAIYFLMLADDVALMLTAYAKNEKDDLTEDDKKALRALLKDLIDD
ncbi:type II toxin-antitoxin system RelE/ParE family toxin [Hyphomicrobium sp.]|uniref:type II toxin-antitoxin system RelE/ParE family toxin n=1 Tax=Hyphomicrobium sp. TaxID=82 RepID=UPI002C84A8C1|nr:type II toxin-antitoxin system RelE/ParE family toxin [Hyphomicrobium sp.]HRQ25796.1 type II toxin-antitoxin system RelE/ParE family toxin [Hyphomicrobium sp.]